VNQRRTRVLHVITGLQVGGAETMLLKLLEAGEYRIHDSRVLVLMGPGPLTTRYEAAGIEVLHLGLERGFRAVRSIARAMGWIRRLPPDIVQGWMYHGNLAASLLALARIVRAPVLWNVRASFSTFEHEKRSTVRLVRLSARLTWHPRAIVYNSGSGAAQHEAIGYRWSRTRIIPNGFPMPLWPVPSESRAEARRTLRLPPEALTIVLVGRFHPMKDHDTFIRAAKRLLDWGVEAEFVLIGREVTPDNGFLASRISAAGMESRFHLLGERSDVCALMPAFDISTLCSTDGESFPNVVGEAMACGIPCVVTPAGDAAEIVGDSGRVVPFRDPEALADAWRELASLGAASRRSLGERGRERIAARYTLEAVGAQYRSLHALHDINH
jgi:glycosyltransferase involved in cell wall biosynthesis